MTSRSRSKRTPGDSVISVPGAKSIIQHAFLRMLGSLLMASSDPEETFKVTDRRRRVQDDEPARPAPAGATEAGARARARLDGALRDARELGGDRDGRRCRPRDGRATLRPRPRRRGHRSARAPAREDGRPPLRRGNAGPRGAHLRSPAPVRRGDQASRITTGAASIVSIRVAPTPTYHNR